MLLSNLRMGECHDL